MGQARVRLEVTTITENQSMFIYNKCTHIYIYISDTVRGHMFLEDAHICLTTNLEVRVSQLVKKT